MSMPPVVYVGPSLEAETVRDLLPQAQVMPPVRRGDLYRDRLLGFQVFVIIDGVFLENLAVSPREVIDVIHDGGIVIGASSMGAMRAAECWPAGMRGVGSIYRLFRRGRLTSDDEVAVSFLPILSYAAVSVPLINVRYAVSRALRERTLNAADAGKIVQSAAAFHFTERTWCSILQSAGIADSENRLATSLQAHDLKRLDAVRALRRLRRWIADSPGILSSSGRKPGRRFTEASLREVPHVPDGGMPVSRELLWRWLVASGRYRRYTATALDLFLRRSEAHATRAQTPGDTEEKVPTGWSHTGSVSTLGIQDDDLIFALRRQRAAVGLAGELIGYDAEISRAVRAQIAISGDADSLMFRFIALNNAVEWAGDHGMKADRAHQALARKTIAHSHGFRTWQDLEVALGRYGELWSWIEQLAEETATAKCVRQVLFSTEPHREVVDLYKWTCRNHAHHTPRNGPLTRAVR